MINFCGDEVQFECLDSNPAVKKWANDHNMTYFQLEQHFWERMAEPGGVLEALASRGNFLFELLTELTQPFHLFSWSSCTHS